MLGGAARSARQSAQRVQAEWVGDAALHLAAVTIINFEKSHVLRDAVIIS